MNELIRARASAKPKEKTRSSAEVARDTRTNEEPKTPACPLAL